MMDITNPDGLRDTVFAIARDGARPYQIQGVVTQLRNIAHEMTMHQNKTGHLMTERKLRDWPNRIEAVVATLDAMEAAE